MKRARRCYWLVLGTLVTAMVLVTLFAGSAKHRPINPPIKQVDLNAGGRFAHRQKHPLDSEKSTLAILASSGGGTRVAAFHTASSQPVVPQFLSPPP
jgi:NTE family protein